MGSETGLQEPMPVGVVGVGHLGPHHARLYAGMADVKLVGIVDSDEDRARSIAAEYDCEVVPDLASLAKRVRAASVAVPTQYHRDVATSLQREGVDVLIEKPISRTLAEADEILDAARTAGKLVMVGHTERFNPAVKALADRVEDPKFFEIHRLAAFSARSTDIDVVLDLTVHDIDLLLAFDRSEVVGVHAVGIAALTEKVDIANVRIQFASGCVANLTASRISGESVRRVLELAHRILETIADAAGTT